MAKRKNRSSKFMGSNGTPPQPRSNSGPASAGIIHSTITEGQPQVADGRPTGRPDRSLQDRIEAKFRAIAPRIK